MQYEYAIVSANKHCGDLTGEAQLNLLSQCGDLGFNLVAVIPQADGDVWFYLKKEKVFDPSRALIVKNGVLKISWPTTEIECAPNEIIKDQEYQYLNLN